MAILSGKRFNFTIRPADVEGMRRHVAASTEEEICGILAGRDEISTAVFPGVNSLHRADRFLLDVHDQLRILLEIERHGWQVAAIYHTHLYGQPYPSETDVAEVYDEAVPSIIWGKAPDGWTCRAYLIRRQEIIPLSTTLKDGAILLTDVI